MRNITYIRGDATDPVGGGVKIVAHVCNDVGAWGRGFVLAVSRRWPEPEADYRRWYEGRVGGDFRLGSVRIVPVGMDILVANMICQRGLRAAGGAPPIRYDALRESLKTLSMKAVSMGATVHMPRIGCGLAGGDWEQVEVIISDEIAKRGVAVTVYDFN